MWKLNYYIAKIMILIVFCNGGITSRASASKFRRIMSAVGTTLPKSPG